MLIQKWVAYKPGRGFHITPQGQRAMTEFRNTDIARKNPSMPLKAYFDAAAYGLRKASLHVMRKRGTAA